MTQLPAEQENAIPLGDQTEDAPVQFIALVKGFSRMFWGVALTAIFFLSQARLEIFSAIYLPVYFAGTALHCWGLLTLRKAGKVSGRWDFYLVLATLLTLLEIYFSPFVHWWQAMPYIPFFTFNVGALAMAVIISLYLTNIIIADFFRRFSLKGERLEARIYAVTVLVFMAAPLLVALVFSGVSALRYQTIFLDELVGTIHRVPIWLYVIVTIPYSLTLAVLWKARDRSYQQFCREKEAVK